MSHTDCLFQSFEGAGSLYISDAPQLTQELLRKHSCRAIVLLSQRKKLKGENPEQSSFKEIAIKVPTPAQHLAPLFLQASQFILSSRKDTNIMVWCPESRQLAAVFVFAHLMLRYGYSLQYIWRIYDQRIIHIKFDQLYIDQLKDLQAEKKEEEEENQKLGQSSIGLRILRIRKNYSDLAKDSETVRESKEKAITLQINPDYSSKKGLSETDYVESCENEPSVMKRRASLGTERKGRRKLASTFDFAY